MKTLPDSPAAGAAAAAAASKEEQQEGPRKIQSTRFPISYSDLRESRKGRRKATEN